MKKAVLTTIMLLFMGAMTRVMSQENYSGLCQYIDIQKYQGKAFTFTARSMPASCGQAVGFAAFYDENGGIVGNLIGESTNSEEDSEWHDLTLTGKISRKASHILIGTLCQGDTVFYFDDFQLSIKGKNGMEPLMTNGTFENSEKGLSVFISMNKKDSVALVMAADQESNQIAKLTIAPENISIGSNPKAGGEVEANGINLYYETYGEGEPLLLLHGADMSMSSFAGIIPRLAKHYKVIALDTRGHGRSGEDGTKLTYELYAADVNAFLDSLGIDKVNVLGWSDGANTGLILAMDYPEKVKRLASMSAVLYNDPTSVDPKINKILEKQIKELEGRTLNKKEEFSLRVKKSLLSEPNLSVSSLSKINCPVLVMAGEHDYVKESHTNLIAENIPDSKLVLFQGAGHNAPLTIPAKFCQTVVTFFE